MLHTPEQEARLQRRSQYLVRRLVWFWPMVTGVDDVERVTLYGYWLSIGVGLANLGTTAFLPLEGVRGGDLLVAAGFAALYLPFYFLGANAVRCGSLAAAVLLTAQSGVLVLFGYALHGSLDLQTPIEFLLFLIMLRGIWLASRYQPRGEEGPPLRLIASFGHGLVDRLPTHIWPRFQWLFWLTGTLILLFEIAGGVASVKVR